MACFLNFNKKVIWIAPPKNGCSTLKSWFWYCEHDKIINEEELSQNIPTKFMNNTINNTKYNLLDFKIYIVYRNIYERFFSYLNNVIYHRLNNKELFTNDKFWINFLNAYKIKNNNIELSLNENIINFFNVIINININTIEKIDPHIYGQYRHIRDYLLTLNNKQEKQIKRKDFFKKIKNNIKFVSIEDINTELKKSFESVYNKKISIGSKNVTYNTETFNSHDNDKKFDQLTLNDIKNNKKLITNNFIFMNYVDKIYEQDIFYYQTYNIDIKKINKNNIETIRKELTNIEKQLTNNEIYYLYKKYNANNNLNNELINFDYIAFKYSNQKSFQKLNKLQLIEHYLKTKDINNYNISFKNVPNDFDVNTYLSLNPDLNKYENIEELYLHFDNDGFYEKRHYK